ncbi:MAG: hypothetical protein A2Z11_01640 [Candidatus Woykebacteria bacterium RBG_16_43_9]|uniref:Uncharacterized protein n=1 Tax=Candidatus Woykebacteria bacterium RBG_16_43_9 TaxID=1802596 RepID=A0A1G1WGK5_9BACT|nr:MAG: hypothetical protein A2Z11_01640 [Candidatus Woykebacteria bacterium RBG_16_43_9]
MKHNIRTGIPQYTYRQKNTADKKIYRRLAVFGGLTVVLLLAIWFWGVTFVNILGLLGTNDSEEGNQPKFELPLRKPTFEDLPEFTNKETITITGSINAEMTLTLFVNGSQSGETTADAGGNFSFVNVSLKEGLNLIKVVATNSKEETKEETFLITLDKTKPQLAVTAPKSGQTFPKSTNSITVKGKTEPEATVFVNLIQATTDQDGNFSYVLTISPGENKIEVKSTDEAGNTEVEKLTITVEK